MKKSIKELKKKTEQANKPVNVFAKSLSDPKYRNRIADTHNEKRPQNKIKKQIQEALDESDYR